jgi:L-aspartate oxidase
LRGEGARLVNEAGEAFMTRYEPAGDLASRDLVSRGIIREAQRTGGRIYLSLAHLDPEYVRHRFPTITDACRQAGLDLATDRIPVSPAAHYIMGGVETDLDGRTSVPNLYAAGEVACTGVHGANRLASNSLLEGLVFGARAAAAMQRSTVAPGMFAVAGDQVSLPGSDGPVPAAGQVRDLVWRSAGLVRDTPALSSAVDQLARWHAAVTAAQRHTETDPDLRLVASLVTVGHLIARAALRREESRGGHFRADFPARDDIHWHRHVADVLLT